MKRSAIFEISGGLGNQLFQLAGAIYLKEYFATVRLDLRPNINNGFRMNEIRDLSDHLGLGPSIESSLGSKYWSFILQKISFLDATLVTEQKEFLPPPPGRKIGLTKYRGYWQCASSAEVIRNEVRKWLDPKDKSGIGMHVRRGDYLSPNHIGKHGLLSNAYYIQALSEISRHTNQRKVTIFTDSPNQLDLLVNQIKSEGWIVTLDESPKESAKDVLRRLSSHEFLIGSNSTFSWWAAFSGNSKLCVFPSAWFVDSEFPDGLITEKMQFVRTKLLTSME